MATLANINEELQRLMDEIEENDGVLTDEVVDVLDGLELSRTEKLENIVRLFYSTKREMEAVKAEKARLTAVNQRCEKTLLRLQSYLDYCMAPGEKFKCISGTISGTTKTKIAWGKKSDCPESIRKEKLDFDIDKSKREEALKLGFATETNIRSLTRPRGSK